MTAVALVGAMPDTTETPIRARQGAAAAVLAVLATLDLPAADWHVSATWPGTLEGQISSHLGTEEERLADITRWADALNAPLSWRAFGEDDASAGAVQVRGEFLSIPVRIFTGVSVRPEQVPAVTA